MDLTNTVKPISPYTNLLVDDMDGEVWADIDGFDGIYSVSSCGRVRSFNSNHLKITRTTPRILRQDLTRKGYLRVCLVRGANKERHSVHRLVAKCFIPNTKLSEGVNHKDFDKTNNRVGNLEWMSNVDNAKDAWSKKMVKYQKGLEASNVSFTKEQVEDIYFSNDSVTALAIKYNRPYMTIYCIKAGTIFKEITNGVSRIENKRTRLPKSLIESCLSDTPVSQLSETLGIPKDKIHNIRYRYNGINRN